MRFVLSAVNLLLRPKARQRLGISAAVLALIGILVAIAFAFAIAGGYMLLADAFGPPVGALLTAAILLFIAICLLIGLVVAKRRAPPPPMIDMSTMAMLGILAGMAGVEAYTSAKNKKDD